jgi:hypothetical protein
MAIGDYSFNSYTNNLTYTTSAATTTFNPVYTYDSGGPAYTGGLVATSVPRREKTPLEWLDAQVEATCALARA